MKSGAGKVKNRWGKKSKERFGEIRKRELKKLMN